MDNNSFMEFMLKEYSNNRFNSEQLSKAQKLHNINPNIHLLTQLCIVAMEDNIFTDTEIQLLNTK